MRYLPHSTLLGTGPVTKLLTKNKTRVNSSLFMGQGTRSGREAGGALLAPSCAELGEGP